MVATYGPRAFFRRLACGTHNATVAQSAFSSLGFRVWSYQAMAGIGHVGLSAESFAEWELELQDLATNVLTVSTLDLSRMQAPTGVGGHATPMMSMTSWDDVRLRKVGRWQSAEVNKKLLVSRFARVAIALQELREIAKRFDSNGMECPTVPTPSSNVPNVRSSPSTSSQSHTMYSAPAAVDRALIVRRKRRISVGDRSNDPLNRTVRFTEAENVKAAPTVVRALAASPSLPCQANGSVSSWCESVWQLPGAQWRSPKGNGCISAERAALFTNWSWAYMFLYRSIMLLLTWLPVGVVVTGVLCFINGPMGTFFDVFYALSCSPNEYMEHVRRTFRRRQEPRSWYEVPGHPGAYMWTPGMEQPGVTPGALRQPWRNVSVGPLPADGTTLCPMIQRLWTTPLLRRLLSGPPRWLRRLPTPRR